MPNNRDPADTPEPTDGTSHAGGCRRAARADYLLWSCSVATATLVGAHFLPLPAGVLDALAQAAFEIFAEIWWGIVIGVFSVGLLSKVPREFVIGVLGRGGTFGGVLRATGAGVLFDVCSHGVLILGMKLYERGASPGQVAAFLVSSPWNSFSLTLILIGLVGLGWTLAFIVFSMLVAIVTGVAFDRLVEHGTLPRNPHRAEADSLERFDFLAEARRGIAGTRLNRDFFTDVVRDGLSGSRMVLRWILFGLLTAAVIRAAVPLHHFEGLFGPTLAGLGLTLVAATIIEVCSEGTVPVAGDLLTRARAPGNAFTFLMAGVATDYTEIMSLRETTKSWRTALFLPLVTLPQILLLGWLMNTGG